MATNHEMGTRTLVLGGVRSGKSRFGEQLVLGSGLKPIYLATGRVTDEEMHERIAAHQQRRSSDWETVEEPLALTDALRQSSQKGRVILVDCLSFWVTNLMMAKADVMKECAELKAFLSSSTTPIVLVSNETGLGILPENKMAREFGDLAGLVNQEIAAVCDTVYFVAAGLPITLKSGN